MELSADRRAEDVWRAGRSCIGLLKRIAARFVGRVRHGRDARAERLLRGDVSEDVVESVKYPPAFGPLGERHREALIGLAQISCVPLAAKLRRPAGALGLVGTLDFADRKRFVSGKRGAGGCTMGGGH